MENKADIIRQQIEGRLRESAGLKGKIARSHVNQILSIAECVVICVEVSK